jgi:hypothetical protein
MGCENRDCLGSPCNVIGFVRHARFSTAGVALRASGGASHCGRRNFHTQYFFICKQENANATDQHDRSAYWAEAMQMNMLRLA